MPNAITLPGLKPVMEILHSAPERILKIYLKKDWAGAKTIQEQAQKNSIPVQFADSPYLDKLCENDSQKVGRVSHQGVIALLSEANLVTLAHLLENISHAPLPLLLALDQVQDPGNLGSIARTAWALGCAGLILPKHNSASLGPGALRSSAGALAQLPVCLVTNLARALDEAEEAGLSIYGAGFTQDSSVNAYTFEWSLPAALVMGSESKGIRPGVGKRCEKWLAIPFARKFDSLNVSQASAILIALCAAKQV